MAKNATAKYTNTLDEALNPKATPQSKKIPGREAEMARNNAGGVSFKLDKWGQFNRFIVMGSEGGQFYVGEKKLTLGVMQACRASVQTRQRW